MHDLVPNLHHLLLQHGLHPRPHLLVFGLMIYIKQLQRILLAIKQLPFFMVRISGHRALDIERFVVPEYELISLISDTVVSVRVVRDFVVHPVPVIRHLLPVSRRSPFKQSSYRPALHIRRRAYRSEVAERGSEIHVRDDVVADTTGFYESRVADQQGHLEALLVHEAFVEPAVLAQKESLVTRVDYDGILVETGRREVGEQASDVVIDTLDRAQVPLHVALVLEVGEFGGCLEGEDFQRFFIHETHGSYVLWSRDFAVDDVEDVCHFLADFLPSAIYLYEPEVEVSQIFRYAHLGYFCGTGTMFVVVAEVLGNFDLVVAVEVFVLLIAFPAAMRRLVMTHCEERFLRIPRVDEINTLIRDYICDIAVDSLNARGQDEVRIPVLALVGDDGPVVETSRFVSFTFAEVPFTYHSRLVAAGAQLFGDGGKAVV